MADQNPINTSKLCTASTLSQDCILPPGLLGCKNSELINELDGTSPLRNPKVKDLLQCISEHAPEILAGELSASMLSPDEILKTTFKLICVLRDIQMKLQVVGHLVALLKVLGEM